MKKKLLTLLASLMLSIGAHSTPKLDLIQSLATSGAREVTPFSIKGEQYLAVPQLAYDILSLPPNMNGGNADADVLIFKRQDSKFKLYQSLPGHGNEGAEFFTMDNQAYLATCSVDSGPKPPFTNFTYQKLYRWDGKYFYPVQQFYGYAAKAWKYFTVGDKKFLALANGVTLPNTPKTIDRRSVIYQWNGKKFIPFQYFDTKWGYDFTSFSIGKEQFLGLTDHLIPSKLFRWNGKKFEDFQSFDKSGGRQFYFFTIGDKKFLALANINQPSTIYLWQNHQFKLFQSLPGKGGRSFLYFNQNGKNYLLKLLFITGTRQAPKADQQSPIYEFTNGKFKQVATIATSGAVKASLFKNGKQSFIAIANSLSKDIRYNTPSKIYQLGK